MKAVGTVPKDVPSAYQNVMERIETSRPSDKELAMRILSWLFRVLRPLEMDELLEALVVEELELDTRLGDVLQDKLTPTDVIECCKSLVIHEKSSGLVRFSHFTVREFIKSNAKEMLPSPTHLAQTCLAYLAFPEFDRYCHSLGAIQQRQEKYRFTRYAARFWADHVRGDPENIFDVQYMFFLDFRSRHRIRSVLQSAQDRDELDGWRIVHIVSKNGLAKICQLLLGRDGNLDHMYLPTLIC